MDNGPKRPRIDIKSNVLIKPLYMKRQRVSHGDSYPKLKNHFVEPKAVICDSGGFNIKIGYSNAAEPTLISNCIMKAKSERKRLFIGNQIEDCRDLSGLYYMLPCEKGYITKWDIQKPIWDYAFQNYQLSEYPLLMTQPIFNFKSIQECMDEIFFEEYEVKSMVRVCPTDLARYQYVCEKGSDRSCIIIDSGYSFTHIVPYINGKKYYPGIKRIFVGGKLLTNYLKDILSYRQLHVMEETYVINQVKEDTCFVSHHLKEDMKLAKNDQNNILRNYILPDFNNIRRGYMQDPSNKEFPDNCQILHLNNERFTVPELLMRPSNIGMQSMGIPEAVAKCIECCPEEHRQSLMNNIVLVGGNTKFPGYKERLYLDIRSLTPCHLQLHLHQPTNPIIYPWLGGRTLSKSPEFQSMLVTKYDYEEYGSKSTYKAFSDWTTAAITEPPLEVKPKPVSILQSLKGVDLFGKGGDDPEEKHEQVPAKAATNEPAADIDDDDDDEEERQPTTAERSHEVILKEVKVSENKNNVFTTIRLQNLNNPNLKSNVISTLRLIPLRDVVNGGTIVNKVKLN